MWVSGPLNGFVLSLNAFVLSLNAFVLSLKKTPMIMGSFSVYHFAELNQLVFKC